MAENWIESHLSLRGAILAWHNYYLEKSLRTNTIHGPVSMNCILVPANERIKEHHLIVSAARSCASDSKENPPRGSKRIVLQSSGSAIRIPTRPFPASIAGHHLSVATTATPGRTNPTPSCRASHHVVAVHSSVTFASSVAPAARSRSIM
jgi:hypothetical protein